MLATFNVTNDQDTGSGSLRAAISAANDAQTVDEIVFTSTFYTNTDRVIDITSALDTLTEPVTIRSSNQALTLYGSFVGVHPLGSTGTTAQTSTAGSLSAGRFVPARPPADVDAPSPEERRSN